MECEGTEGKEWNVKKRNVKERNVTGRCLREDGLVGKNGIYCGNLAKTADRRAVNGDGFIFFRIIFYNGEEGFFGK